ncbi:iron-siderophore ABC transporter substrate-binding protein [Bacillus spongiae]|uniref:Iron-siderophore ABC transporter substrate-binding protein n=1 Tax=Bacillus spongiae TaxID=2683610 RepID=A0ABU8HA11_9BACI
MFKKKLSFTLSVLGILTLLLLAACSEATEDATKVEGDKGDEKNTSYMVTHAMGSTEIKETPKKIVVLTNESTEALLALDVKPIGAVQSWEGDPWYDHIKGDMDGVEVVGNETEVNIERIIELKPDLIIGNKIRQEAIYDKLEKIAPTIFSEDLSGDWKVNFDLYAKAVNLEEKGQEVMNNFDQHVLDVKESLGDNVNKEISVVRFSSRPTRIYYTDSFSGVIFEQLGFKRAAHQEKLFTEDNKMGNFAVEVGKELIPEMDADAIFYFTYTDAAAVEEEWINDPLWKNLNAVQSGNVYKVNDTIWNTAGGVIAANTMLEDIKTIFAE